MWVCVFPPHCWGVGMRPVCCLGVKTQSKIGVPARASPSEKRWDGEVELEAVVLKLLGTQTPLGTMRS